MKAIVVNHIAKQCLESLKNSPAKIESGLLPHVPDPGDADFQEWLERFEKAVEEIGRGSKGQK